MIESQRINARPDQGRPLELMLETPKEGAGINATRDQVWFKGICDKGSRKAQGSMRRRMKYGLREHATKDQGWRRDQCGDA
jgi:hypothetical protein